MLQRFLDSEANHKEMADEMLHFINSYEIRRGEFECNEHVIEKLDADNFIVYNETVDQNGNRAVIFAFSIYRKDLQNALINKAKQAGYQLNEGYLIK